MSLPAELAAGATAGLAVAVPVGPVAVYLLGLGARSPWRTGAAAALGVATVDGGYAVLACLGGLGLRRRLTEGGEVLAVTGALVLVAVALATTASALRRYREPVGAAAPPPLAPLPAYAGAVAMTAVNPTTLLTFAAVVLARTGAAGPGPGTAAAFAAGAFAASATWQLLLVVGGVLLGRVLPGPRGRLVTGLASGLLMLGLAAGLLLR